MFAFMYRAGGGIVPADLRRAYATLASPAGARCWISEAGDVGVVWVGGALLAEGGADEPRSGRPFALAHGRLDVPATGGRPIGLAAKAGDSQRIAACALREGEAAPHWLPGDFALAHWTGCALYIAVDHLGQEGLYYARTRHGFAVATRLPALLSLPDTPRDLDGLELALVAMTHVGRGAGHTAFASVRRLTGGHGLWLEPGLEAEERRWWNPDLSPRRSYRDPRDYTAELATLFDEAVRCRLPARGPVGCTLSGGLDSTLVAGFAAPILAGAGRDLHAWTSVPHPALPVEPRPGWDINDWDYARQMTAIHPNIRHHAVSPEGVCLLDVQRAVHASSATPTSAVANHLWFTSIGSRAREAGCEVVLTGAHGNASVSFHGNGAVASLIRHGRWLRAAAHLRRTPGMNGRSLAVHLLAATGERTMPRIRRLIRGTPAQFTVPGAPLLRPVVRQHFWRRPAELTPVAQRRDWLGFITRSRTSFAVDMPAHAGVELRDPTSDRRLCEYLLGCPAEAFIGAGFDRLQARLLGAGRVPDGIRWRRTLGEQSPEQAGFFALYPERYQDAWAQVRRLPWAEEFVERPTVDRTLHELVRGGAHPRPLAAAVHRILDAGLFVLDAQRRWPTIGHTGDQG